MPGKLAFTCGDPAGIGPEIIASWLAANPAEAKNIAVIGPARWLETLNTTAEKISVGLEEFSATLGQARPQELSPEAQARVAVFGVDVGQTASDGEKMFVRSAGGDAIDRNVRAQVDFDDSQTLRKNRSITDMILNFGGEAREPVIDPAAEAERLRAESEAVKDITGGGKVIIQPKQTSKLPGL